jgi:DNA-binding CsgD family transcriptional regulator
LEIMRDGALELIQGVYDAVLEPKGWASFVEAFEERLGGAAVMLQLPQWSPDRPWELVAPSFAPTFLAAYQERFVQQDPFRPGLEESGVGSFEFGDALVLDDALEQSSFHHDWLAPQELLPHPSLHGVLARDPRHGTAAIRVFQRRAAPRLARRQWELGQRLMPHLQQAVKIHFQSLQNTAERCALLAMLDHTVVGLIAVDARGHVLATNRAADRLVAQRDGLSVDRDGVEAAKWEETASIRQAIEEVAHTSGGSASAVRAVCLSRPSGRPALEALVTPVAAGAQGRGSECPRALLLVSDPANQATAPPHTLARFYGLTRAEARVACILASGSSLAEASQQLGISVGTVRTHLRHLFEKTQTHRQAALVRLLLATPVELSDEEACRAATGDHGATRTSASCLSCERFLGKKA